MGLGARLLARRPSFSLRCWDNSNAITGRPPQPPLGGFSTAPTVVCALPDIKGTLRVVSSLAEVAQVQVQLQGEAKRRRVDCRGRVSGGCAHRGATLHRDSIQLNVDDGW